MLALAIKLVLVLAVMFGGAGVTAVGRAEQFTA